MSGMAEWLKNLLYPNRCIFCGTRTPPFACSQICASCLKNLTSVDVTETKDGYHTISAAVYSDALRRSIINFKFFHKPQYAAAYACLMEQGLRYQTDVDFITWVPASLPRRLHRGYDQSELLARELGKRLSLPVRRGLRKIRHTKKQSLLDREKRMNNVRGTYRAVEKSVKGKRILVVDDVLTTGATMNECIRVLYESGASFCVGAVIARADFNNAGQGKQSGK